MASAGNFRNSSSVSPDSRSLVSSGWNCKLIFASSPTLMTCQTSPRIKCSRPSKMSPGPMFITLQTDRFSWINRYINVFSHLERIQIASIFKTRSSIVSGAESLINFDNNKPSWQLSKKLSTLTPGRPFKSLSLWEIPFKWTANWANSSGSIEWELDSVAPEILVNFFPEDWFKTDPDTSDVLLDGLEGVGTTELTGFEKDVEEDVDVLLIFSLLSNDLPLKNATTYEC